MTCTDHRCVNGVTACGECNGWGRVKPSGGRYRTRHGAPDPHHADPRRRVPWVLPAHAIGCGPCNGTGYRPCGCAPLTEEARRFLAGGLPEAISA